MRVICNATPLINFAAINRLDILEAVFGQIVIPQAVYDETTFTGFLGSEFVLQAIASVWLQVRSVSSIGLNIPPELDKGEREAIALAIETGVGITIGFSLGYPVGYEVVGTVVGTVGFGVGYAVGGAVVGVVAGTSLGMIQWLVLRRSLFRTGWWVLANTLGATIPIILVFPLHEALDSPSFGSLSLGFFLPFAVYFAVFGAITGGALVWLMRTQPAVKP
ncbi:MAG: hypothetical protein RMY29_001345 [Nostoc sp. CreGUA01]|nr:hypothetical protein [Nostoc sp. CreGUA01]